MKKMTVSGYDTYLNEMVNALSEKGLDCESVSVECDFTSSILYGTKPVITMTIDKPATFAALVVSALRGVDIVSYAGMTFITSRPSIKKVITNGPAVIALFDDGTKQVAKAHDCDAFDPRFGTLWCALRKAARNRAIVHLEKAVRKVAQQAKGPDDYEALGNALLMVAQHMKKEE